MNHTLRPETNDPTAYRAFLEAQSQARELEPGSAEWLEATGRVQKAWAVLEAAARQVVSRSD